MSMRQEFFDAMEGVYVECPYTGKMVFVRDDE